MTFLALFDCDGTLVDSQANICLAMEEAFSIVKMPAPPRTDIRHIVGLSLVEAMRKLLPEDGEDLHNELAGHYRNAFLTLRRNGLVEEPLYDGMAGLLSRLDENGWQLGVATGKSDRGLQRCLDHHGLGGLFVTLQTADRHPSKPHPSMVYQAMADAGTDADNTVMIGDTLYDIHMGIAANCRTIGVSWGYHDATALYEAGADIVVNDAGELYSILEQMR